MSIVKLYVAVGQGIMANFASTKRPQHVLQQRPQPHALQQLHHVIHVNTICVKMVDIVKMVIIAKQFANVDQAIMDNSANIK